MRNTLNSFIERSGQTYNVERNGAIIHSLDGLANRESKTHRQYIGFLPGSDVIVGDCLVNSFGDKHYIIETKTITLLRESHSLNAYYLTESEYNKQQNANAVTFNIENAYGSVIGTQTYVNMNYNDSIKQAREQIESSNTTDKEELHQILSLLEMVVNNQVPVNKGLFSKFSDVMERNSWISSSITSALLSWLTTRIGL